MAHDNFNKPRNSGFSRSENSDKGSNKSWKGQSDPDPHRGHFPPAFYKAKDENYYPRKYPSEFRYPGHLNEDVGNYGKGGYYGSTYRETSGESGAWNAGHRENYRQLGDRRWADNRSWEDEGFSRLGYSQIQERFDPTGAHKGKGPRSYRRSDERILEDLNDRLYDDPYLNAADIETTVSDGEVILTGTVEDKKAKRRAEDIGEGVSGVRNVENRLRIKPNQNGGHQPVQLV